MSKDSHFADLSGTAANTSQTSGAFIVSLDFELHWGIRDRRTVQQYRDHLLGARQAVPAMLALFERYGIHATWATVGLLFFETLREMQQGLPGELPKYHRAALHSYTELPLIGADENEDPYHYASSLIRQILKHDGQEIGTHTFSHFYATEPGATLEAFRADLKSAKAIAARYGVSLKSLVFPNNQYARDHVRICAEEGWIAYRSTDSDPWLASRTPCVARAMRLAGAYAGSRQDGCFLPYLDAQYPIVSVSSSRFLRPWSRALRGLESLRIKRICDSMSEAARNRWAYHLWWHPHNFGVNLPENIAALTQILEHYSRLKREWNWPSLHMAEVAESILNANATTDASISAHS